MANLTVSGVSKCYQTHYDHVKAVDNITLSFQENQAVAIVGPSGSGKSTLLKIMGLALQPDSGRVELDGQDVTGLNDGRKSALRNRMFGYVVQDFALLDEETVYENIRLPLLYHRGIRRQEHRERVCEAAEKLGIADKLRRKAGKLSGGERQRVAIARAIVCGQPILLADEPTGSLDAANRQKVVDILLNLCREQGKLLILVTHDPAVAEAADVILSMRDGKILD